MNGVRTIFTRKGYLLTALAAAVLLAASTGTAEAQRVSIGFVETSGQVSEKAFLDANSLEAPQRITVSVSGLLPGSRRAGDVGRSLGDVTITPSSPVWIARVTATGAYVGGGALTGTPPTPPARSITAFSAASAFTIHRSHFEHSDEVTLVVAQSSDGTPDGNWRGEPVSLKLETGVLSDTPGASPASVNPDVFALSVEESHVAPVAKFLEPDFTLSEQSDRTVNLDVASAIRGVPLPGTGAGNSFVFAGAAAAFDANISIRVSNPDLVVFDGCPGRLDPRYNRKLFNITLGQDPDWVATNFTNTGVLTTVAESDIRVIADQGPEVTTNETASFLIEGCGDGAGIRDPYITLTVMDTNLVELIPRYGSIDVGPPLMVSIDSDEAAPTLSFSPTDVEIDEGGETSTVLLAEGPNASDVGMVKLMVEGDAMVDLYQDGTMLEEMGGYVTVDLGGNSSARLMAMSTSDPDLMDGEMKSKAWKLVEGETDGADIGEGSWFKVDVRGSTAVPALPLVGQLLLALFLMAGGSRLYRRRRG